MINGTTLKVVFVTLAIAVTLTCLVLSDMVRLPSGFIINTFNIPLSTHFHANISNSSEISRGIGKIYSILIFNPPLWLIVKSFNETLTHVCDYSNCRLTTDRANLHNNSAIIYYLTAAPALPQKPPIKQSDRNTDQVWIFAWLESPVYHTGIRTIYQTEPWRNTLNWTMTYTHDADVLYPYGAIRQQPPPAKNYSAIFHRKTKMVAWIVSNCYTQSQREKYVKQLQQYGINVDVFGACAGKRVDSDLMSGEINSKYKFYLSFENSLCKDYISEKFFKYFRFDVILVVRGGGNYSRLLTNNSYVNTADFDSVKDLAKHLLFVGYNEERYTNYLMNKDRFKSFDQNIRTESFCKICEKLNNLEKNRRTYNDFVGIVRNGTCFKPSDVV